MYRDEVYNVNIVSEQLLPSPQQVKSALPLTAGAKDAVLGARRAVKNILDGKDSRMFAVVGPCSVHDVAAAEEYAERLKGLAEEVAEEFVLLMRVYFEKPRTTVGWKGFINDPFLDDSFQIDVGLHKARELLLTLGEKSVPAATEALDPVTPQYIQELITWTAIGARTTESQTHREMSSGLSAPVGFKNGTDGSIKVAVDALKAVSHSHHFLGINSEGQCAVFQTRGNSHAHIVLRGGSTPNYDAESVRICEEKLRDEKLPVNIVVDCSHGNSLKKHQLQPRVFENCVEQIVNGNESIIGLMIESHLFAGRQDLPENPADLRYGVSITDACIDWETTERIIRSGAKKLSGVLKTRRRGK